MTRRPLDKTHLVTNLPPQEIVVGIGELHCLRGAGVIRTLVGSCIALALYDLSASIGGLAHIVHPQAPFSTATTKTPDMPGKYADTAIEDLIQQILNQGGNSRRISAKFAGGAQMFAHTRENSVGNQNIMRVRELLTQANIPVLGQDCGGKHGRRVSFEVSTGKLTVETVGHPKIDL